MAKSTRNEVSRRPRRSARDIAGQAGEGMVVHGWGGDSTETPFTDAAPDMDRLSCQEMMADARRWFRKSHFLPQALGIKIGFLNYGFRIAARDSKNAAQLRQWLDEDVRRRMNLRQAIRAVWEDMELMDNAVVMWRNDAPAVVVTPPEKCRYSDAMGMERLWVNLGWKAEDLQKLPEADRRRYAKEVEWGADTLRRESFAVIKRARVGWGFSMPRIAGLFRTLAAHESLEVADQLWSFLSRSVIRMFKVGHEIRNGPRAGHATWFVTKQRADAVRKKVENKQGLIDLVVNFDHSVDYPVPPEEAFAKARYEALWPRMRQWLGPLGLLLENPQALSAAMVMFRADAAERRADIAWGVERILDGMGCKIPVRAVWSNQCFNDPRIAAEMLKTGLASGPVSQRSFLDEVGLDPETERESKKEESDLAANPETAGQVLPIFDPAHGKRPGAVSAGGGGRPAGTRDAGGRDAGGAA